MSRIGKLPVHLGKGVECTIADGNITVKGPKGEVTTHVLPLVGIEIKDGVVHFTQLEDNRDSNANMGTQRALVNDMVKGVTVGFEKKLTLVGVGYRAQAQGDKLNLQVGFSPPRRAPDARRREGCDPQPDGNRDFRRRQAEGRSDRCRGARLSCSRTLQGQGHPLCRRTRRHQGNQEEVTRGR